MSLRDSRSAKGNDPATVVGVLREGLDEARIFLDEARGGQDYGISPVRDEGVDGCKFGVCGGFTVAS